MVILDDISGRVMKSRSLIGRAVELNENHGQKVHKSGRLF